MLKTKNRDSDTNYSGSRPLDLSIHPLFLQVNLTGCRGEKWFVGFHSYPLYFTTFLNVMVCLDWIHNFFLYKGKLIDLNNGEQTKLYMFGHGHLTLYSIWASKVLHKSTRNSANSQHHTKVEHMRLQYYWCSYSCLVIHIWTPVLSHWSTRPTLWSLCLIHVKQCR